MGKDIKIKSERDLKLERAAEANDEFVAGIKDIISMMEFASLKDCDDIELEELYLLFNELTGKTNAVAAIFYKVYNRDKDLKDNVVEAEVVEG